MGTLMNVECVNSFLIFFFDILLILEVDLDMKECDRSFSS